MDAGLWRRLGYPRRLNDGSFAVTFGFDRYRLEEGEFPRYLDGYAIPRWVAILGDGGWATFIFCLFFFSPGVGIPIVFAVYVVEAVESRSRVKRFKAEFPRARPIRVLASRWPGYGFLAQTACSGHLFVWMLAVLVVGWGTGGMLPNAMFGWPLNAIYYGAMVAVWGALCLAIVVFYRATRGCRLSLDNIEKTEAAAAFVYMVPTAVPPAVH